MVGAGAGVGVAIVLWDLFPVIIPLAVGVVPAVWIALGKLEPSSARHRREVTLNVLPEALDLMGACLRAGQPLRTASITVGQAMGPPMGVLFNSVNHAISVGMSDEQAWKVLGDDPVIGEVARDIARCASWGTTTVEVLAHHSRALRRAAAQCRINRAKQVGVKSVLPLGLCYLPAFLLLGVVPVIAAGVAGFLS
jgi:pilus assembly protein TadC